MTNFDSSQTAGNSGSQDSQRWQAARSVGRQRLSRISEVLKSASQETFSELKTGTSEFSDISREALEQWIAEQKGGVSTEETTAEVRDWKPLLWDLGTIVRDRKSDWLQSLAARLAKDLSRFEADMDSRPESNSRLRQSLRWLRTQLERYGSSAAADKNEPAHPIQIEVLEGQHSEG